MKILLEILGILSMVTVMFVAIWGFIVAKQAYSQIKYQNYLLEKLTQNIYLLVERNAQIKISNPEQDINSKNESI
ncbi:hypothetical protein [Clostridium paridis]|uniref:Uncharacterized protein n=1 Tax=Clostridium paridis TaxID=2803863 RepID=A0A937FGG4_9CLOT|nr:hypothetical protein [Clostridium paridis]MBL4933339.1 hypothetical protein [Clostridium paridis]